MSSRLSGCEVGGLVFDTYFLTQDSDSHWYVVPVDKEDEWNNWCEIDSDDERAWTPPLWAVEVGGSPTTVHFTNWTLG